MVKRVGMLLKPGKPDAIEIAQSLVPFLAQRGLDVVVTGDGPVHGATHMPEEELREHIDLMLVLGGDGTLLHAAGLVADRSIPILGINLGHLGFLSSCSPVDAHVAIDRALKGELRIEDRLRLRCVITRASGLTVTRDACNDAVVSLGALARLIELEAYLDGSLITRYRADGLIVSTPTGSTAYNLAAGGPIVAPDVCAMVVTPICPHTLTNRPVVVPAASRLAIRLAVPVEHVMITIDGQWGTNLAAGDTLEISQASPPLYLYRPAETYFDVLRRKLSWGERVA